MQARAQRSPPGDLSSEASADGLENTVHGNYLNSALAEVRERTEGHFGLFAKMSIRTGDLIGCYAGQAVLVEINPETNRYMNTRWEHRQVWQLRRFGNRMLGLVSIGGFHGVDFINHSCKANTAIVQGVIVIASREIAPAEEITMDYRQGDSVLEGIPCWCPESKCII